MILECCWCRLGKLTFLSAKSTMSEIKSKKSFYATLLGTTCLACLGTSSPALAEITISGTARIGLVTTEGGTGTKTVSATGGVLAIFDPSISGLSIDNAISNCGSASQVNCVTATIAAPDVTNTIAQRIDGGIIASGSSNTIELQSIASIQTSQLAAHALTSTGSSTVAHIAGQISTAGNSSDGVLFSGDSNVTTMSGNITTTGTSSNGFHLGTSNNSTTMSGSITTTGDSSIGLSLAGSNNKNSISGSIMTTGRGSPSIILPTSNNLTTLLGSSITSGENSAAILFMDGSASGATKISGNISTTGSGSHGIYFQPSVTGVGDHQVDISATISSTGPSSSALYHSGGSGNSFKLNEGTIIVGDITNTTKNAELNFNLGQHTSYAYSISGSGVGTGAGQWTINDNDGRNPAVSNNGSCVTGLSVCNLVTVVSTGNAEVQNELQHITNNALIGSMQLSENQVTSNTGSNTIISTKSVSKVNPEYRAWARLYGGSSKRTASAADSTISSFDTNSVGLTIGKPILLDTGPKLDLIFNGSTTNLNVGASKTQQIKTKSYSFGGKVNDFVSLDNWDLAAFGFIGRNSYDSTRKVISNSSSTGFETISASYAGMGVLVGVDAQYSQPIDENLNFKGSVNANLNYEEIGTYSESKYFAWGSRRMLQVAGGFTTGFEHQTDAMTTFGSVGAQRSSLQSGRTATYVNNGTSGSYANSANGDTYRTASFGVKYEGADGISMTTALNRFFSTGGVSGTSASLEVHWKF